VNRMRSYSSMEKIEKDFFPSLFRERELRLMRENPGEWGRRLARKHLEALREAFREAG